MNEPNRFWSNIQAQFSDGPSTGQIKLVNQQTRVPVSESETLITLTAFLRI